MKAGRHKVADNNERYLSVSVSVLARVQLDMLDVGRSNQCLQLQIDRYCKDQASNMKVCAGQKYIISLHAQKYVHFPHFLSEAGKCTCLHESELKCMKVHESARKCAKTTSVKVDVSAQK